MCWAPHQLTLALAMAPLIFLHRTMETLAPLALFPPLVSSRRPCLVQMIASLEEEIAESMEVLEMIAPLEQLDEPLVTRASKVAKARRQGSSQGCQCRGSGSASTTRSGEATLALEVCGRMLQDPFYPELRENYARFVVLE